MVVELISVGTELLLGNIVNTNAAFLAEKCAGLGLSCYYQTVVGDNRERLAGVMRTAVGTVGYPDSHRRPWAYTGRFDQGDRRGGMEQRIENGRPFPGADRILF